jgi:hypothetical protein
MEIAVSASSNSRHCLITGVKLTAENDSIAHIIPSALGGRLKWRQLISNDANNMLNEKFDLPLIKAYQNIMVAVGGNREGGKSTRIVVKDDRGEVFHFEFGHALQPVSPVVDDDPNDGLTIKARRENEVRRILKGKIIKRIERVRGVGRDEDTFRLVVESRGSRLPFEISMSASKEEIETIAGEIAEAILGQAEAVPSASGTMSISLPLGPDISFPAAYVMVSLYAAHFGVRPEPHFREYVTEFNPSKVILPPKTFYFMPEVSIFGTDAELAHQIVLMFSPAHQALYGYVSIFGIEEIVVVLPYDGTSNEVQSYAVNVLTGKVAKVKNIEAARSLLPWQPTPAPGDPCWQAISRRARPVWDLIDRRIRESNERRRRGR